LPERITQLSMRNKKMRIGYTTIGAK